MYSPRDGMDGELDFLTSLLQQIGNLDNLELSVRQSHSVSGNDDDDMCVLYRLNGTVEWGLARGFWCYLGHRRRRDGGHRRATVLPGRTML